jgi:hypothetical protein
MHQKREVTRKGERMYPFHEHGWAKERIEEAIKVCEHDRLASQLRMASGGAHRSSRGSAGVAFLTALFRG